MTFGLKQALEERLGKGRCSPAAARTRRSSTPEGQERKRARWSYQRRQGGAFLLAVGSQGFVSLGNFAVMFMLLRQLSLDDFGFFALVSTIYLYAQQVLFANLLSNPYINVSARLLHARARYEASFYAGSFMLVGVAAFCAGAILFLWRGADAASFILSSGAAYYVFTCCMTEFIRRQLSVGGNYRYIAVAEICRAAASIGVVVLLIVAGRLNLVTAFASLATVNVVYCGLAGAKLGIRPRSSNISAAARRHFREGGTFVIAGAFATTKDIVLQILVAVLLGDAALGLLRAAQLPFGLANPVLTSLDHFLPVRVRNELDTEPSERISANYRWRLVAYTLTFASYVATIAIMAAVLMPRVLPEERVDQVYIWLFALSYPLMMAVGVVSLYIRLLSLFRPALISAMFSAVASVGAFALALPWLGAAAAVVGAVVGLLVTIVLQHRVVMTALVQRRPEMR